MLQSELEVKISEIKQLREKMKAAAEEARGKEDLFRQLVSNFVAKQLLIHISLFISKSSGVW